MVNELKNGPDWPTQEMIAEALRSLPDEQVPTGFSARVMSGLQPKRPSLWLRCRLWLTEPKTFSMTPLTAASAMAALLLVLGLGLTDFGGRTTPETAPAGDGVLVRFVLSDASAQSVAVVGSFNNWKGDEAVMRYDKALGEWVLEARIPPGDHEYMFLVNGSKLVTDPQAQVTRDDGFGHRNSILFVNNYDAMSM